MLTHPSWLSCTALLVAPLLTAQIAPHHIAVGTITDSSGAIVSGARISSLCGAYTQSATTAADGTFQLPLRQGTCTVRVVAGGFAPYSQVVESAGSRDVRLDIHLTPPSQSSVVTVTARQDAVDVAKIGADPMDLPLAVETVSNQLVEDEGFTRLIDVVRNVSGVTSKEAYMGVTDTFNVRGFDASSSLFNGFRRDYYGTVNDLSALDRVEIIKGPSSVTEGFLEPGGVVNIVTKRPLPQVLTTIDFLTNTFGTARGQGDVNIPLTDRVELRATGALEHRASWRDYIHNNLNSAGLALNWTPTSSTLLESRFYNTYLVGVPDRGLALYTIPFNDLLALPIGRLLGEPADQYKQRNTNVSETVHQGLGASWSVRAGVNFFQLDDFRNNTEDDSADSTYPNLLDRELTVVTGSSSTVNAVAEASGSATTFHIHHHITGGVDYQRLFNTGYFTENFNLPLFDPVNPVYGAFPRVEGPVTYWSYGYTYDTGTYAQDLLSIGRHIRLLAGVRQDQFNYHDHELVGQTMVRLRQGAFSPRVGLVYQPVSSVSIYGNYATSFNPQQGIVLLNGDDPTPSRGRQAELGVKVSNGRFAASADLFRIRKTNVATGVPGNADFSQLTGAEQSTGGEFDGRFTVRQGLVVRANISDTRAVVTKDTVLPIGARLLNVPRLQGTLWAEGDIPHTKLSAAFGWFAVGQREATLPNSALIPKYNRFDAALYYQLPRGFKLQANLQNFSNVRYYTSQDYELYPGAPINAQFSVHWTRQHER